LSFAALTMNKTLDYRTVREGTGFSSSRFLFEIPSNLALKRFGARVWIARIMVTWGIISMAMAFVVGAKSFFVLRFLLA